MRRNHLFILILLILTLLFPSLCMIAKLLHYSFTVKNGIVYAIVTTAVYDGIGILLMSRKDRQVGKPYAFLLSACLLLNQIHALVFVFYAANQTAMLFVASWFVMTAIIVAYYVKNTALLAVFYSLAGVLVLPIFLFLMLSGFGAKTVIAREVSPDRKYCAEVIDDDQGALGGATQLLVYRFDQSFSIGSFEFRKSQLELRSGPWGEFESLSWQDSEHLSMNEKIYEITDYYPEYLTEKERIIRYVRKHEGLLLRYIEKRDDEILKNQPMIRQIRISDAYIDFSCGGDGFGPETSYWGFYYSEKDDMSVLWCAHPADQRLEKSGDGYMWKEAWYDPRGDNTYYTEWICGHFYYYEMTF